MTKVYKKERYDYALKNLYDKKLESGDLVGALSLVDKMEDLSLMLSLAQELM